MSAMETCTSRMPRFSGATAPGWSAPSAGTTSTALPWLHTSPGSGALSGGGRFCTCRHSLYKSLRSGWQYQL